MPSPNKLVYINCPFDREYKPFFEAIVFTINACGYLPQCALESPKSVDRLAKMIDLIDLCSFSIHDLSRTELDSNMLPRFNMAFELGMAYGRKYRKGRKSGPELLVMDRDLHRFKLCLSDFKGCDVVSHSGNPLEIVALVRNWLSAYEKLPLNGPVHMKDWFTRFQCDLPDMCGRAGLNRDELVFKDLVYCSGYWLDTYVPLRALTF